jgi:hypothetical protein
MIVIAKIPPLPSTLTSTLRDFLEELKVAQMNKKFQTFIEFEDSLPCPQKPAILVPILKQLNLVQTITFYSLKILFNIVLPSTLMSLMRYRLRRLCLFISSVLM